MNNAVQEGWQESAGSHRDDIDGLRAIAVCAVIAYHVHIGFHFFDAGFIGVDIFFVISGYLISGILLRDLDSNRFSIARFYERRIRRIFPALVAVLLFTTAIAWHSFFPADMVDYSSSLIAAVLSVSNMYFWQKSGYFDFSSARRPLLHTWSLAVEEQFYIVFPILLFLLHRYARSRLRQVVVLLAVISFLASAILVFWFPTVTFYLAPTRAWELLMGTMLSLGIVKIPDSRWKRNIAGITGLLLIFGTSRFLSVDTPFPGAAALPPCLGAALLIASGHRGDTLASRLLSFKPIAFVGIISYSLYLWHWPLLALRLYDFTEGVFLNSHQTRLLVLAETFVISIVSWRFIETPFRTGFRVTRRALFLGTAGLSLIIIAFAVAAVETKGFPQRYSADILRVVSFYGGDESFYREGQCFLTEAHPDHFDRAKCLPLNPASSGEPTYVLAGSSHAAHLWIGLSTVFPDIAWQQLTASNCRPTMEQPANVPNFCRDINNFLFKQYLPVHRVDAAVLSTIWSPEDFPALGKTLDYLASLHIKVYVVGPIMQYDMPLPELLAIATRSGSDRALTHHLARSPFEMDAVLSKFVGHYPGATYISLTDILCPAHVCVVYAAPLTPLQSDQGHLTREGSIALAERLKADGIFSQTRQPHLQ